jgi:hypothetical protein
LEFINLFKVGYKINGKVIHKTDEEAHIQFWNYDKQLTVSFDKDMMSGEKLVDEYGNPYHFYWWLLPSQAECYQRVRNWYWKRKEPRTPAEIYKEIVDIREDYDNRQHYYTSSVGATLNSLIARIRVPNLPTIPERDPNYF